MDKGNDRPPLASPYPGLAPYGDSDDDAALFFGREAERDLIIANLRSARLTVLYGSSGVGKSSLLRAGVVHHLRSTPVRESATGDDGGDPHSPVIILDEWAGDAGARLIAEMQPAVGDGTAPPDAPASAADVLAGLRARRRGALLIILDQFEEYLRLHPDPVAGGFEDLLSELLTQPEVLVRVLIAVRDDRLADLDRFEGRIPNLLSNYLRLEPLTREAAREAIVGPIDRYNARAREQRTGGEITLEPGLADQVLEQLSELIGRPGTGSDRASGTPIEPAVLQLTMRRLWDSDTAAGHTTLQLSTLAALGGAQRIFATHLDVEMAALPLAEQRLAAEVFRFLVTPSGATRSFSAADLGDYVGRPAAEVEALAEKLSRAPARILRAVAVPASTETHVEYELSHQVLARPVLDWRTRFQTGRLERRAQRLFLGLVAVTAVAFTLVGYVLQPGPLQRLELTTVDQRFAVRGAQLPDRNIVLVTVDDRAYARLISSAVPARATYARALDAIAAAGARAIASDVIFTGAHSAQGDAALIRAVDRNKSRLVLGSDVLDSSGLTELFGRTDQVFSDQTSPAAGYVGFPGDPADRNSVIRTMQRSVALPGGMPMSTLGVVSARRAGLLHASLARLPASAWIAFRGGAGTFPSVSLDDVVQRRSAALSSLAGKIVVLGVTAKATGDQHQTSAPGKRLLSGPEIQADAISTAMRGFPLRDGGRGLDAALIVVLGLAPLALGLRLTALNCALGILAAAALFCVGAQLAFDAGRVISVVYPLISLALAGAGVLAVLVLRARRAA